MTNIDTLRTKVSLASRIPYYFYEWLRSQLIERNFQTLKKRFAITFHVYLLHSSHAAFATFAMTSSRVALFAPESETKTAIAICRPFGSVTIPTSLVAAVTPSTVRDVPVLCAITVPSGNKSFNAL